MGDPTIAVKKGQFYRTRPQRKGAHWRYARIIGVSKGQQPKVTYVEVTKTGKKKSSIVGRAWLQIREGEWQLPEAYELVTIPT